MCCDEIRQVFSDLGLTTALLLTRLDPDTIVRKGTKKGTKRDHTMGDPFTSIARKGPKGGPKSKPKGGPKAPLMPIARKGQKGGTKKQTKRRSKSAFMPIARKGTKKFYKR